MYEQFPKAKRFPLKKWGGGYSTGEVNVVAHKLCDVHYQYLPSFGPFTV